MSASPRFSMANRVVSSGMLFNTSRLMCGTFPPVTLVGPQDQADAGVLTHELIGPRPDRMLLEPIGPDLLDVRLGHDPGGSRCGRRKGGQEVGPWCLQVEPDAMRIDCLDL